MLLNKIWKDIPNYEGLYQISDLGRIKSLHWGKEKILKQTIRSKNYPYYFIGLLKDKKRKYYAIHRLVAEVKRTREEKRQYQREYYRKHKMSNLAH